ncbi:MAG: DUF2842 domain-containing protein [Terricaulis sp.]
MDIRARKAVGCAGLLAYLAIYAMAAATLGGMLANHVHPLLLIACYAIAGVAWVLPLKPLFTWMNGATK